MERIKLLKVVVSALVHEPTNDIVAQLDVSYTQMMWHIPDHTRTLHYYMASSASGLYAVNPVF